MRDRTTMGLELFEVGSPFRPTFKKRGICKVIGFEAKLTFAVFFLQAQELTNITNCPSTIEDISKAYQLPKGQNLYQIS